MRAETAVARDDTDAVLTGRTGMPPTGFSCPDCGGVLYAMEGPPVPRYRCRVGHAWGAENLAAQQDLAVETALWTAIRTLEEKAELTRGLAERAAQEGHRVSSRRFRDAAEESGASAALLKRMLDDVAGLLPGASRS
jgi:two-component system chemotaxis response regulator CheB